MGGACRCSGALGKEVISVKECNKEGNSLEGAVEAIRKWLEDHGVKP